MLNRAAKDRDKKIHEEHDRDTDQMSYLLASLRALGGPAPVRLWYGPI
jgi:hypothetical protein